MELPTDLHKLEEVLTLLKRARLLMAVLSRKSDDLDNLLSVAESEAKRVYAATLSAGTAPGAVPLILSNVKPDKPKRARRR